MASGADNLDAGSTIVAEASAPLRAAIAVLRVSGPAAGEVCRFLTGRPCPAARRAVVRTLRAGPNGEELDQAMVIWLPGPGSFSGEDMLELHVHGGASVRAAVLTAILSVTGVRPAAPGEFSKRAFLNGRMDLTQAEAIADLVDAETVGQRRQALRQMAGALGGVFEDWRGRLLRALAHLEAVIDFSEEDLPADLAAEVRAVAAAVAAEMTVHLADQQIGERVREGLRVAVLGPPNVGKSSLINHLAARDIAIVSARAGTTRDVLEAHLDIAGLPVVMADTAGLRASGDDIERIGMARARAWAEGADFRVLVLDRAGLDGLQAVAPSADIVVVNKADLGPRQGQVPEGAL
ncbi:MAG: tRNA uridine-5-carboxymethylaminomethyl(34) synthesis GTPase MnmE, partial [Pseudomonadota bacterium]|nr:tRNA uridine-5-carboxymethylaminomethyl(34) synthesis GTPase MnmE [Pseudomonadota bacterium]